MQRYTLFALKTFGIILSVLTTIGIIVSGVLAVGNWQHRDYGTANQASGAAAGIVKWHDTLVTRINGDIVGEAMSYKAALAYGSNTYTFFDQSNACKVGQGYVNASGILQSKKYVDNDLLNRIKHTLDANNYTYTVTLKHGQNETAYHLTVSQGSYVTRIDMKDYHGEYPYLGAGVIINTFDRHDGEKWRCYPIGTLPKPHLDSKYL